MSQISDIWGATDDPPPPTSVDLALAHIVSKVESAHKSGFGPSVIANTYSMKFSTVESILAGFTSRQDFKNSPDESILEVANKLGWKNPLTR